MSSHIKDEHAAVLAAAKHLDNNSWSDTPGGKRRVYKIFAERRPDDWDDISDAERPNIARLEEVADKLRRGELENEEPLSVEDCRKLTPAPYRPVFDTARGHGFSAYSVAAALTWMKDSENHSQKELSSMFGCTSPSLRKARNHIVENDLLEEDYR